MRSSEGNDAEDGVYTNIGSSLKFARSPPMSDPLSKTLSALSSAPCSLSLHKQHISLAGDGGDASALSDARDTMVGFVAATDGE